LYYVFTSNISVAYNGCHDNTSIIVANHTRVTLDILLNSFPVTSIPESLPEHPKTSDHVVCYGMLVTYHQGCLHEVHY